MLTSNCPGNGGSALALTFGELENWKASDAEKLVTAMVAYIRDLEDLEDEIRSASKWDSAWSGSSGETGATAWANSIGDAVTDLAANAAAAKEVAIDTSNAVSKLQWHIDAVNSYANSNQFSISSNGDIIDNGGENYTDEEKGALLSSAKSRAKCSRNN